MANTLNIPGLEAVLGQMARRIQNMELLGKQAFNHILIIESATQPVLVENGEMCIWHDTDSTGKWLLALVDGTHYKVDITGAGGSGTGDMLVSVYDPTGVNDDAFDTDNHKDGTTNRVYTATEESKLAAIEASADVTDAGNVGSSIHGATAKTTPVDADTIPAIDSEASNVLKKVTWANIKSTLKTYFDTLYNKYVHPNHSGDVTSVADGATTIADDAVTNAKAANMAANTMKANATASTADPADLAIAANKFPARASTGNIEAKSITDFAFSILDDTDGAGVRSTIGAAAVADLSGTAMAVGGTAVVGVAATAARSDHKHAFTNPKIDDLSTPDDNTDLNASTSAHGLVPKAVAPAANTLNVVGIANGETAYTNKTLFDATAPAAIGTAAAGTSVVAAHRDHVHTISLTGDVTTSSGVATTIANDAVSNAKMANMAANTIKGRVTASTGDPEDLTAANVRTIINVADGATANAKATGAELTTGTDDAKFATAKAIKDAGLIVANFAVAAKGVTNGDSHDHNGGDGAQIDHVNLANKGTNTHAQIDTHIGSTSNPHSTTADQVLPTQTGNNGKFLTTNGTTASWGALAGGGDMAKATYDPPNKAADAFSQDNMVDGTTNKNYTATEKTKLAGIATSANNYAHPNHSGDVTSSGDGAQTIANDAVSNAKAANMAANTIKGRITASTGDPEDLTAANVRTIINVADGATANAKATGAELNTGTDDVKFATAKAIVDARVYVRAYSSSEQTDIVASTPTKIVFGTENYDTGTNFATSTFTCGVAGYYRVTAQAALDDIQNIATYIWIYKNGSEYARAQVEQNAQRRHTIAITTTLLLAATDTVEIYLQANTSGNVADIESGEGRTFVCIEKLP